VGLAHTVLDDNPTWGALLDNLHVVYGLKRQGVGTRLLPPGGDPARLRGKPKGLRYTWPDPARLLSVQP
jgi:hypothetical protein